MNRKNIKETTTSGSIASVSSPIGKPLTRAGSLFKGKKTKKKFFENSPPFATKQQLIDYFISKGKTAAEASAAWERGYRGPLPKEEKPEDRKPTILPKEHWLDRQEREREEREEELERLRNLGENELVETDLILLPGQVKQRDRSFKQHHSKDHEISMASNELISAVKNAKRILDKIKTRSENKGLMAWQQSYITLSSDYLNSVADSLETDNNMLEMTGGVIAGGMSNFDEGVEEGTKTKPNTDWHGSKNDLDWYQLYKMNPVKVKIKNTSGIGGAPSGTFIVKSFTKTSKSDAEFTIVYQNETMHASLDLDNPPTYVDKNYDRKPLFKFYSGNMPISARQAFNLIQIKKNDKQGIAEGSFDNASPMFKDSIKQDKIRSLKNLIAIAKKQGRKLRVQELELELKKLQGVAEGLPGGLSKSDYTSGKTIKHTSSNCTTCHGRKVMYKLDGKLFADNKKGATKVKCPTCKGTGAKQGVAETKDIEQVEEASPFTGIGKMLMKRKLNKGIKQDIKAQDDSFDKMHLYAFTDDSRFDHEDEFIRAGDSIRRKERALNRLSRKGVAEGITGGLAGATLGGVIGKTPSAIMTGYKLGNSAQDIAVQNINELLDTSKRGSGDDDGDDNKRKDLKIMELIIKKCIELKPSKYKRSEAIKMLYRDNNLLKQIKQIDQTVDSYKLLNMFDAAIQVSKQWDKLEENGCPHCGGKVVSEELLNEKKDACYYKVKSRYKVWPSAYASGALVKCRKKGASNWGKSKANEDARKDGLPKNIPTRLEPVMPGERRKKPLLTRNLMAIGLETLLDEYLILQGKKDFELDKGNVQRADHIMMQMDELEAAIKRKKGGIEKFEEYLAWYKQDSPDDGTEK